MKKTNKPNLKLVNAAKNYSKISKGYLSKMEDSVKAQLLTEYFQDSKEDLERCLRLYELELIKWSVLIYHQANISNTVNAKTLKLLSTFINPGGWISSSYYHLNVSDSETRFKFFEEYNITDNTLDFKLYCRKYSKYVYTYLKIERRFESVLAQRQKLFPVFVNS